MDNETSPSSTVVEDSPGKLGSMEELQSGASSEQDKYGTEYMPKGPTYSLNSKQPIVVHLQQIADLLGLPTKKNYSCNQAVN